MKNPKLPEWITIIDESEFFALGKVSAWPDLKMGDELLRAGYLVTSMDFGAHLISLVKTSELAKIMEARNEQE